MNEEKVLLVDGQNLFLRVFSAVKKLTATNEHIGAITGFLRSIGYYTRELQPSKVIVLWEGKYSTINRKNLDPNYKLNRQNKKLIRPEIYDSVEEELESMYRQGKAIRNYLKLLPVHQIEIEKYEADDLISHIVYNKYFNNNLIISTDKDFYQLVSDTTQIYLPTPKKFITTKNVLKECGTSAINYIIAKAVCGDKSDNLAGIRGIGIKTLVKKCPNLLSENKLTLDEFFLYCAETMETNTTHAKIVANWKRVVSNYKIMNLNINILTKDAKAIVDTELKRKLKLQTFDFIHNIANDKLDSLVTDVFKWLLEFNRLLK